MGWSQGHEGREVVNQFEQSGGGRQEGVDLFQGGGSILCEAEVRISLLCRELERLLEANPGKACRKEGGDTDHTTPTVNATG